jgi:hypothetical protein
MFAAMSLCRQFEGSSAAAREVSDWCNAFCERSDR